MKKRTQNYSILQRLGALVLAMILIVGILPSDAVAAGSNASGVIGEVTTAADPGTIRRHEDVYGNDTENAGKVTVGKSVSDSAVTIDYGNTSKTFTPGEDNFIVTVSQTAQTMGLASESAAPVDVVFVLDTSGSMNAKDGDDYTRAQEMVTAANDAIKKLMDSNPNNRVGVVAFSSESGSRDSAQVLSSLAHYSGNAATNHLQWVNSNGGTSGDRSYIAGRNTTGSNNSLVRRQGTNGGTNIHAGIALGAQQLTQATELQVTLADGETTVTRMPFLIILSDGQPTYIANDVNGSTWYNPSYESNYGDGNDPYEGAGFVAALTAAYYKGKISEHYYGNNVDAENRCTIYTVGVELDYLTGNDKALAQITMDPREYTTGDYAQSTAKSYWNYGNSHLNNTTSTTHGWKTYWNNFTANTAADFDVRVNVGEGEWKWIGEGAVGSGRPEEPDSDDYWRGSGRNRYFDWDAWEAANDAYEQALEEWYAENWERTDGSVVYTVTAESIAATKRYVTGDVGEGYNGGIAYNDDYFSTEGDNTLADAFEQVVTQIQKKAMASPTHVDTTHGEDFSGYVTFTDPIGEYMEVKDVYGVLADGNFYQGKTFAQYISNWDSAPTAFKNQMINVLRERCEVTGATMSDADAVAFLKAAAASKNQANYNAATGEFDNSIVWWGKSYQVAGEEDIHVQWLDFADNDTVEYIEDNQSKIQQLDADYVCRSYYFYDTAGGTVQNPNHDYLHFVVRVQRSLKAPYQQTVVVSTPASLLSVEKVLITEKTDTNGNKTYTASVTEAEPARVVYEVGLHSQINAYNVAMLHDASAAEVAEGVTYVEETTDRNGKQIPANYNAETGEYIFYTNDWDRTKTEDSHHRAMTHATFDAAADNSFYAYTEDTLLYTNTGTEAAPVYTPYNSATKPTGAGYFYARTVYDWSEDTTASAGNTYDAEMRTVYIPVKLPSNPAVTKKDDGWYVNKGVFKSSELTGKEDVIKRPNTTETASIISHPHRTEDETNSHYTVLLGNNGRLTLKSEKTKTVSVTQPDREGMDGQTITGKTIQDADGKPVMVDDVLTYSVRVDNPANAAAKANVVDFIPRGTEYVDGSATNGGVYDAANRKITWTDLDVAANGSVTVSFKVKVTAEALSGEMDVVTIDNTAAVTLNNGFSYETNTTKNPPEGKKIVDGEGNAITGEVVVPSVLSFRIRWYNDTGKDGTKIVITDKLPTGTTFNSASHNGVYDATTGTITWTLNNIDAGVSGVVSFRANVNPNALETINNKAEIRVGENDPRVTVTNKPGVEVKHDDLIITKTVVAPAGSPAFNQEFKLNINDVKGVLSGEKTMLRNGTAEKVYFKAGSAYANAAFTEPVTIKHGDTLMIQDIPVGTIFSVTEAAQTGFTASYKVGTTTNEEEGRTAIVEDAVTDPDEENSAKVEITNTYKVTAVNFNLDLTKTLNGELAVADAKFGFTATAAKANGDPLTGDAANEVVITATVSNDKKPATATFPAITFTEAGTYYYVVKEVNGGLAGINYDDTQYLLTIKVEDTGTGTLVPTITGWATRAGGTGVFADASGTTNLTFTNSYVPKATQLVLEGTKELTGRSLKAGEFSFEIQQEVEVGGIKVWEAVASGTNDANGKITFTAIPYTEKTQAGNPHTYRVVEIKGDAYGVTYSDVKYTLKVTVTDNDGQLETSYTIDDDANKKVKFENSFKPDDKQLVLNGTKSLKDGDGADLTMLDQEFAFVVEEKISGTEWKQVAGGNNDASGKIVFSALTYKSADFATVTADASGVKTINYVYRIRELTPVGPARNPNMDYDDDVFYLFVTATYDTVSGELNYTKKITATEDKSAAEETISFQNVRYPNTISVTPTGFKHTYSGNSGTDTSSVPSGARFSFLILEGDKEVGNGVSTANPDGTTPNITFSSLTYGNSDVGKTYTYTIKEAHSGVVNGITHDPALYTMTVAITREDSGELKANVTYTAANSDAELENGKPSFENRYNAEGYLNITAKKTLNNGTDFDGKTFSFTMLECDHEGNILTGAIPVEGVSDASGNIKFATLYFGEERFVTGDPEIKTVHFKVSEVEPASNKYPGVTYDKSTYHVTIELKHNSDGTIGTRVLSVNDTDVTGGVVNYSHSANLSDNIKFNNTYAPIEGTSVRIEATKELTGRDLRPGEFNFDLYYVDTDDNNKEYLVDTAANVDTDDQGTTPDNIYFVRTYAANTKLGTYTYIIRENANVNLGGMTYDPNEYKVTVTIKDDNGDGKLDEPDVTPVSGSSTFRNAYKAKGTEFAPELKKDLVNRNAKNGEFSFEIKAAGSGNTVATGRNTDTDDTDALNNNVVFTPIAFNPVHMEGETNKSFDFYINETAGLDESIDYDETVYGLRVTVKDEGNGFLDIVSHEYFKVKDDDTFGDSLGTTAPIFKNTYYPQDTSIRLKAAKVLTGRDMLADEFSFVAKDKDGNIKAVGDNAAAAAGEKAVVTFSGIGYSHTLLDSVTAVDGKKSTSFLYVLTEENPTQGGVTKKEEKTIYAKVTLTLDTATGELTATDSYYSDEACTTAVEALFENNYAPTGTSITIPIDKTLINKDLAKDEFTFILVDKDGKEINRVPSGEKGVASFKVDFTLPGEYTYQVKEIVTSTDEAVKACYKMDAPVNVKVQVDDNLQGQLVATTTYYRDDASVNLGGVEFVNYYTAPALTKDLNAAIDATKTVKTPDGSKYDPSGFQFKVVDTTGKVVKGRDAAGREVDMIGTSDKNGKITFPKFYFPAAGEYHYWVSEMPTDKGGVTIDGRVWEVHILVRYNHQTGELYVDKQDVQTYLVSRSAAEVTSKPAFENVYAPAPKTVELTAKKVLEGRNLKDREFLFQLMEGDQIAAEAYNDADGNIKFYVTYTKGGTHTYTMREVKGSADKVTYDKATFSTAVSVKDDGKGNLTTSVSYGQSSRQFTNVYTPDPIKVTVNATKTMTGDKAFAGEEFTFQLKNEGTGEVFTEKNDELGQITFELDLDKATTYHYTMSEVKGDDSHITYDPKTYEVTIEVEADSDGKLHAEVTYNTADGTAPAFENIYKADPISLILSGTKTLKGREMKDGEFSFVVHDGQKQVATATNDKDGKLTFSEIHLPVVGEYTLNVSEVKGTDSNVTYDDTVFTLTIKVTNDNGVLVPEITGPEKGIAFVNEYEEPEETTEATKPTEPAKPDVPDTGDHSNVFLFGAVAVLSLAGLLVAAVLFLAKRKKKA